MGAFHSTQNYGNFGWYIKWNGPFPEYSGPALKVILFDRSGYIGRLDRNVPFHLTKLLSPVPLFCILLTRTITKRAEAWVGSVQPECTVPLGTWNFRNFKPEFLLNGKRPTSFTYKKDQRGLDGKANDLMLGPKTWSSELRQNLNQRPLLR